MTSSTPLSLPQLPAPIAEILNSFLQSAKDAFGSDLISVVLFGSAAEGKLRATSDLNLDRKSTRLNSSHLGISYAVFCLKKKKKIIIKIVHKVNLSYTKHI